MYVCMYKFLINAGWRSQEFQQNADNNHSSGIRVRNSSWSCLEYQQYAGNNSSRIPAEFRVEFQWNTGGMPAIIPSEFRLEFQCNTGGMPATIPAEFQWNTGGMPAIIPVEFQLEVRWNTGGMPAIIRRNSGWKCPEFQGNTGGMLAIIPGDSSGILVESVWNLPGILGKSGLEFRQDSTGIPGLVFTRQDRDTMLFLVRKKEKMKQQGDQKGRGRCLRKFPLSRRRIEDWRVTMRH